MKKHIYMYIYIYMFYSIIWLLLRNLIKSTIYSWHIFVYTYIFNKRVAVKELSLSNHIPETI